MLVESEEGAGSGAIVSRKVSLARSCVFRDSEYGSKCKGTMVSRR